MNKTVIISGSDGYLGGKIIKQILNDTDLNVLGLTMSLDMPERMLEREQLQKSNRLSFITNEEFFQSDTTVNDIYGAIHLAFSRRMQPAADIASSIDFAAAFFHRLVSLGADRVINMSSQGVYGNTSEIRTEETPAAPATQYTMAKYAAEVLFRDIMRNTSHHTNFRLDPVAQSQNVIKGLCKSAKAGAIHLKGGKQVFSFIDSRDVGRAVTAMLLAEGEWAPVYNVGWNCKRYTLMELADLIAETAECCGYKRPEIDLEENETELWAGMESIRFMNKTGWTPSVQLKESIKDVFNQI